MRFLFTALLLALLPLAGRADVPMRPDIVTAPTPEHFSVCYNNTCAEVAQLSLPTSTWQQVEAVFSPPPADAEGERSRIAQAVALMERIVGPLTGTEHDLGRDVSQKDGGNEMDCIDEATNTTTYLRMFAAAGLLRWHSVEDKSTRGWFLFGWPHTTAVIRDTNANRLYAVDSWFLDNGEPPFILPLEVWRHGWQPPKAAEKK